MLFFLTALVDSDLSFFQFEQFVDYESYTNAITYKADHDIYENSKLYENEKTFEKNSGTFTIHWINDTNIYLILIENYLVKIHNFFSIYVHFLCVFV